MPPKPLVKMAQAPIVTEDTTFQVDHGFLTHETPLPHAPMEWNKTKATRQTPLMTSACHAPKERRLIVPANAHAPPELSLMVTADVVDAWATHSARAERHVFYVNVILGVPSPRKIEGG